MPDDVMAIPSKEQKIRLLAFGLFGLSFFLPAYVPYVGASDTLNGLRCLFVCWSIAMDGMTEWSELYYAGFVFTNLLFVLVGAGAAMQRQAWRAGRWLGILATLHVFS
jgi:hypothetical protein